MKIIPVLCFLFSLSFSSVAQNDASKIVSSYIYVGADTLSNYQVIAFQLKTPENATVDWKSTWIYPLLQDSASRFLIKADVPVEISESVDQLECTAITKNYYKMWNWLKPKNKRTTEIPYGGIDLSVIKLEIKSDPQGADVYMVPIRIWDRIFKDKEIQESIEDMELYKVNTSVTDTFVRIDQTVFKIIFHANGLFKTITHRPLPQSIEPIQTVSVKF